MKIVVTFLTILSVLFSSLNPFAVLNIAILNKTQKPTQLGNNIDVVDVAQVEENIEQEETGYKIKNFIDMDLEGYCTISYPQSHFTLNIGKSNAVYKELTYKDNKSKLYMSYVTNIGVDADIPGYITIDVAGVDTVTNGKTEEIYGNNIAWMKVPSTEKEEGCNVYVWYTLNTNKSAAFWVKAKITPDSEDEEFYECLRMMYNTYNYYQYGSGTVFDTPTTGYYDGLDFNNGTQGDTSNYVANDRANTVFQTRGGYIEGYPISEDWKDLQIAIDDTLFSLPCKLQDFYDAGFVINDRTITDDQLTVYANNTLQLKLINNKGTVVSVVVRNENGATRRQADECTLVTIIVNRDDFVNMGNADLAALGLIKNNEEETEEEIEEEIDNTEDEYEETEDESEETEDNEEETDEDLEDDTGEDEEDTKKNNKETNKNNNGPIDALEDAKSNEIEEKVKSQKDELDNISDYLDKDKEYKEHGIVLAGGVTWGVYLDDAIAYYGSNCSRIAWNGGEQTQLTWQSSEKYMRLRIGSLHTLYYVEISCDGL